MTDETTGSPDYVMVPRVDDLAAEIRRVDGGNSLGAGALAEAIVTFLAAASPSPRSDEGSVEAWKCDGCGHLTNDMVADIKSIKDAGGIACCPERKMLPLYGSTPSKLEGFSAALRAQVIEECAKWHDQQQVYHINEFQCHFEDKQLSVARLHECFAECHEKSAKHLRSLSAVSAIAQERDVGKPVGYRYRLKGHDFWAYIAGEVPVGDFWEVQPLYLHPTTSPSAISEAPTSAEAVKTSPEVGEMVESLEAWAKEYAPFEVSKKISKAASLLIALDAERGRMRGILETALGRLTWAANANPGVRDERGRQLVLDWVEEARSALPASDEGTNNE